MADPMRIRAQVAGAGATVRVLMSHEMETGQRKDSAGKTIPAWFIQEVSAALNGKPVLTAQWGPSVAKNPFLQFSVKGAKAGDKIAISWLDNRGDNGIGIRQHRAAIETQHDIAAPLQPRVPLAILRRMVRLTMLTSVQFNDELRASALEIDDVSADRRLAAEMQTVATQRPQTKPQAHLGICHAPPQGARDQNLKVTVRRARLSHDNTPARLEQLGRIGVEEYLQIKSLQMNS